MFRDAHGPQSEPTSPPRLIDTAEEGFTAIRAVIWHSLLTSVHTQVNCSMLERVQHNVIRQCPMKQTMLRKQWFLQRPLIERDRMLTTMH